MSRFKNTIKTVLAGRTDLAFQVKELTLDGSNPSSVTMDQLRTVKFAVATFKGTAAPGLEAECTVNYSGSNNVVDVYAWAHTSSANPTLVASTNNTRVVSVLAFGESI
jgi:hypothetical protein